MTFERYTDRARRVVTLSSEEARNLGHNYIGTEHLLLGLIAEGEGVAAQALANLGFSKESVRKQVESVIGRGGSIPSGHLPFTLRSRNVLELSLREALQLGHNYIGTEHILLGLVREAEGMAAKVIVETVPLAMVRVEVVKLLSGYQTPAPFAASQIEDIHRYLGRMDELMAEMRSLQTVLTAAIRDYEVAS